MAEENRYRVEMDQESCRIASTAMPHAFNKFSVLMFEALCLYRDHPLGKDHPDFSKKQDAAMEILKSMVGSATRWLRCTATGWK